MFICREKRSGFTLIELLVVISIIALLLSIMMPALSRARKYAQGLVCSAGMRSLVQAWILYAEDNQGRIVSSSTSVRNPDNYYGQRRYPWVYATTKSGIERGLLFPYTDGTAEIYSCPLDRRYFESTLPEPARPMRTYSIVDTLNGHYGYPENPRNGDGLDYQRRVHNISEVRRPSDQAVFLEEGDKNQLGGSWAMTTATRT